MCFCIPFYYLGAVSFKNMNVLNLVPHYYYCYCCYCCIIVNFNVNYYYYHHYYYYYFHTFTYFINYYCNLIETIIFQQGEGAPTLRKGTCARHLNDVNKFLRGVHVTVSARTEEEVEPDVIMAAVLKASATTYNFKERSEINEKTVPVVRKQLRVK